MVSELLEIVNTGHETSSKGGLADIGLVIQDSLHRQKLLIALKRHGLTLGFCRDPENLPSSLESEHVKAWIVDVADASDFPQLLELNDNTPVLFGIDPPPPNGTSDYARWEKRIYSKLTSLLGEDILKKAESAQLDKLNFESQTEKLAFPPHVPKVEKGQPVHQVIVLGASLGGPGAIKAFLDSLPEGLPIGFIYAQHIDQNFHGLLSSVLTRHSWFDIQEASDGHEIVSGDVILVPSDRQMHYQQSQVRVTDEPWPGPYGPSVDQTILNVFDNRLVSQCFIFSGMGSDGAEACATLKDNGLRTWAQSSDSCECSLMPDSVRDTHAVEFSASPEGLAKKLLEELSNYYLASHQNSSVVEV